MQKVGSVLEEYAIIFSTLCKCGARLDRAEHLYQALGHQAEMPVDQHAMRCRKCGQVTEFEFDISSFYPHVYAEARRYYTARQRKWRNVLVAAMGLSVVASLTWAVLWLLGK